MTESYSVLEIYKRSIDYLSKKGIKNPKPDTEWIFKHILRINKIDIFLNNIYVDDLFILKQLRESIIRRGKREPLQHIIGNVEFYNCTIKSDKRALIPRFETESLVDLIVSKLPDDFNGRIVDLGTGSGAIIISLSKKYPHATCIGLDKSVDALSLARENITLNNCGSNVVLRKYDWMKDTMQLEKVDVMVSNPPYLSLDEWSRTEPEVRDYDPKEALVSDKNGYSDLEAILKLAPPLLQKNGLVALEFGNGQAEFLCSKYSYMFDELFIEKDLCGKRRFLLGKINS